VSPYSQWHPVVRYDTAHGFAHRDLLDIKGRVKKTPLFNQDYNDALSFAESDLKANWLGGKLGTEPFFPAFWEMGLCP